MIAMLLSACSSSTPDRVCTPGESRACVCASGSNGAQVCAADGLSLEDAGVDAGVDAGGDAGSDAGQDGGCDGGTVEREPARDYCTDPSMCPASTPVCSALPAPETRSICEQHLVLPAGYPEDADDCLHHADCDDGVFCNGAPRCDPSGTDVDARHCTVIAEPACEATEECDERGRCVTRGVCG